MQAALKKSVASILTDRVPTAREDSQISQVENMLLHSAKKFDSISYVYVLDREQKLIGIISIKEIFRLDKHAAIADIMQKKLVAVRPQADQERAALLAIQHNLKAIPVTEPNGKFLGVVATDEILKILHREHVDDLLKFSGISAFRDPAKSFIAASVPEILKKRGLWVFLGMIGGMLAALLVSSFEESLREHLILASFIPLVVYLADAVGTQTETLYIRSRAIDHALNLKRYLWREAKVGVAIALSVAVLIALGVSLIFGQTQIGILIGLSLFAAVLAAMTIDIFLPWTFEKLSVDPAMAAGPFATIVIDITTLAIYFGIAQVML